MCGIAGVCAAPRAGASPRTVRAMCEALAHRGPDDEGYAWRGADGRWAQAAGFEPDDAALPEAPASVVLGHRRLAILDPSAAGHQPMASADRRVWITYNGELYNFIELRQELTQAGDAFTTASDTEVVLAAYRRWGAECLHRFNGMWAFALWDEARGRLLCARDRLGVKPFYYRWDGQRLWFASEIKALLAVPGTPRRPDEQTVFHYLSEGFGYTDNTDRTFFEDIRQLPPGCVLELSQGQLTVTRYWELPAGEIRISAEEAAIEFRRLFLDAVRVRLRADTVVGSTLSGGLDSSAVTCAALSLSAQRPWPVFSSTFEGLASDERCYAALIADRAGVQPHWVSPGPEACWQALPRIVAQMEEPFTHLNAVTLWHLLREAHQAGVRVVLNGHGGDEALAGYRKDTVFRCADLLRQGRWAALGAELDAARRLEGTRRAELVLASAGLIARRAVPDRLKDAVRRVPGYAAWRLSHLQPAFVRRAQDYVHAPRRQTSFLAESAEMSYRLYPIPGWLRAEDRLGMAQAVESRSPFLDYRLVEFCLRLPGEVKLRGGVRKRLLREAVGDLLPSAIRDRQDKMGFPTPVESWLRTAYRERVRALLASPEFAGRGIVEPRAALRLFERHCAGEVNARFTLWSWINLELWFRQMIEASPTAEGIHEPVTVAATVS